MAKNRFEQVDEPQDDAITLALGKGDDGTFGTVNCPATLTGGRLKADVLSGKLAAVDAFRASIKLANEMRAPIVVLDPEGLWQEEWGTLYRPV
jgi:hypothetical protein